MKVISRLVFGFDIDGVLTNDDDGKQNIWLETAAEYFEQDMIRPSFYIKEAFGRTTEEVLEFFAAKIETIFQEVPPRPHSASVLQRLYQSDHIVHLITARDEQHKEVTESWLRKHRFPYHSLTMSPHRGSYCKGERCAELDVDFFVDDKLENAEDVAAQGIYTLLFHASHNKGRETSLPRVNSWREIESHIDNLMQKQFKQTP